MRLKVRDKIAATLGSLALLVSGIALGSTLTAQAAPAQPQTITQELGLHDISKAACHKAGVKAPHCAVGTAPDGIKVYLGINAGKPVTKMVKPADPCGAHCTTEGEAR